jgi:DNA-binding CsgD family transcriptional regulator
MSHSSRPTHQQLLDVLHLMTDVAALKGDPAAQRIHLIDGLALLVGTNQGMFFVGDNWRPGENARFTHQTLGSNWDPGYLKYLQQHAAQLSLESDAFCDHLIHDPSKVQELSFARVLPDRATERKYDDFVECRIVGRVTEGIVTMVRSEDDRVIGVCLHAFGGERGPSPRDRALTLFAVQEINHLCQRGHLSLPPHQPPGLPPRLQQVMDRLLAGQNPKRVAMELGLSLWTIRDHIKRIYRHFGVSGREELTARFVNAPSPPISKPAK